MTDWLDHLEYGRTRSVPAFPTAAVYPLQDLWYERRLRQGRPIILGCHSRPGAFLEQLPERSQRAYRLLYLHQTLPGLEYAGLIQDGQARWQITAVQDRYLLSSIAGRSPGEFVYLGDDSGLLIEASRAWLKESAHGRALDLCCGCGVVGLNLPSGFQEVIGLDANATAIELARANVRINGMDQRCHFEVSDMWSQATGQFDFVVGNPPALPVRPDLLYAFGGHNPAELTLRAVAGLDRYLAPEGRCLLLSFSVRDQLWKELQRLLPSGLSLEYQPRRHIRLSDPQLGWMEHCWIRIWRDPRGLRRRLPMSWWDRFSQWSVPWSSPQPIFQECYAGRQRPSR